MLMVLVTMTVSVSVDVKTDGKATDALKVRLFYIRIWVDDF